MYTHICSGYTKESFNLTVGTTKEACKASFLVMKQKKKRAKDKYRPEDVIICGTVEFARQKDSSAFYLDAAMKHAYLPYTNVRSPQFNFLFAKSFI